MTKIYGLIMWVCMVAVACSDDDSEATFKLEIQKYSHNEVVLNWKPVEHAESYQIWRTSKIDKTVQGPLKIATVDWLTLSYTDTNLPVLSTLEYYVTATVNGKEVRSNLATEAGAEYFNILPYQVKPIPNTNRVVVRGPSELVVVDYDQKFIVTRKEFPGKIGAIDIATFGGKEELYVPVSDKNVYICNPQTLAITDTLETRHPVESVAVNKQGIIFLSNGDGEKPLKLYHRSTLELISQHDGETGSGITLQSDYTLLTISSHISPAIMSYYTFSPQGELVSKTDDPYSYDYEMDASRFRISDNYIVTATKGFIYTADENMTLVTTLENYSNDQSDFEFGPDGNTVYVAITDERALLKATISHGSAVVERVGTQGYPWVLTRHGDELIVISSPDPFYLYSITNKTLIERISIK